jgi:hypothetical protein
VGLANLGSESETCVGSRVHLVGVSISFEKNFYRLPFTPPSLVRRIGPANLSSFPSRKSLNLRSDRGKFTLAILKPHLSSPLMFLLRFIYSNGKSRVGDASGSL